MTIGRKLETLLLERTRRCNLKCDLCYKGDSEKVDMLPEVYDEVFEYFNTVLSVNDHGGEPQLVKNPELLTNSVIRNKLKLHRFAAVSNGTFYNKDYFAPLKELYDYIIANKFNQKGLSPVGISLSWDPIHDKEFARIGLTLKKRQELVEQMKSDNPWLDIEDRSEALRIMLEQNKKAVVGIYNIGRARENNIVPGTTKMGVDPLNAKWLPSYDKKNDIIKGRLAINPFGDITNPVQDYNSQRRQVYGNILKQPLEQYVAENIIE